MHVRLRADKGVADDVRVLDDELQRFQVIGGKRRYVNARFREIDSLLGAESLPFRMCLGNFNGGEF